MHQVRFNDGARNFGRLIKKTTEYVNTAELKRKINGPEQLFFPPTTTDYITKESADCVKFEPCLRSHFKAIAGRQDLICLIIVLISGCNKLPVRENDESEKVLKGNKMACSPRRERGDADATKGLLLS